MLRALPKHIHHCNAPHAIPRNHFRLTPVCSTIFSMWLTTSALARTAMPLVLMLLLLRLSRAERP